MWWTSISCTTSGSFSFHMHVWHTTHKYMSVLFYRLTILDWLYIQIHIIFTASDKSKWDGGVAYKRVFQFPLVWGNQREWTDPVLSWWLMAVLSIVVTIKHTDILIGDKLSALKRTSPLTNQYKEATRIKRNDHQGALLRTDRFLYDGTWIALELEGHALWLNSNETRVSSLQCSLPRNKNLSGHNGGHTKLKKKIFQK